jgi:RHS repeat-associated protein
MKKHILSFVILLFTLVSGAQVSQNKNYVLYSSYDTPVQAGSESPSDKKQEAVYYLDGNGRTVQQTAIKAGADSQDINIYNSFDAFNRQKKQYLAYPKTNNNGAFITDPESLIAPYYNSEKYGYTLNPYSEAVFDQTHITRPVEIAQPGNEWKKQDGHTQKSTVGSNLAADKIRIYATGYDVNNNPLLQYHGYYQDNQLIKQTARNENWVVADGNNNTTQIFSDFSGRRILMRNFDSGTSHDTYYVYDNHNNLMFMLPPNAEHSMLFSGTPGYTYPNMTQVIDLSTVASRDFMGTYGNGYITITIQNDVLYISFDATFPETQIEFQHQTPAINSGIPLPNMVLGNLNCLPNLSELVRVRILGNAIYLEKNYNYYYSTGFSGSFSAPLTTQAPVNAVVSVVDKYCYQYKYDKKNRLIKKKLPGVDWQYFVYDDVNRPVLAQDARQRASNEWTLTKFDPLGRVAYTAILTGSTLSQEAMQADINGDVTYIESTWVSADINGEDVNFMSYLSPVGHTVQQMYYYDNYDFYKDGIALPATGIYGDVLTTSARGQLTGSMSRAGTSATFSTEIYLYDRKDRPVYMVNKDPYLETFDIVESKIDFTGKVLETKSTHTKTGVITDLVTYDYYTYDHTGRLTRHNQKTGNSPTELITFNKYDELGNMQEKKVGRSNTSASVNGLSIVSGVYTKIGAAGWTTGTLTGNNALKNDGNISFRVGSSTVNEFILGASYAPVGTTYSQINYCFMVTNLAHPSGGKGINIQEAGVTKATTNCYPYDELTIERIGTVVYYKKNGALIYTSLVAATAQNLYPDGNFYSSGSTVTDLNTNNYNYTDAYALQTIAYKFDVRGMLTKINDPASGTALFNMEIKYASPAAGTGGTAFYNGNVSQIHWRTANDATGTKRYYNFGYDHLHRLRSATFNKVTTSGTTSGFYNESMKYDKAGNISFLQRYGTSESSPVMIDNLTYTYDGNQLLAVADATSNAEGFNNNSINLATEFTYDNDGNLKTDKHKGITAIVYNEMNLPTKITFSGTNRFIDFVYDPQGNKISKSVQNGANNTVTQYAGNYVYVKVNGAAAQLQYAGQPEGYIAYNAGNFNYVYQYTDHLGNIRLSYTDANSNGAIVASEIIEENNYYPFGLKHKGYNSVTNPALGNPYQKIGFEGQEMQEDLGLNWSSFKWRNYDPALGRFFNIDPLAEKYSFMTPYQFASNQPVHAPELEGMENVAPIDDCYEDEPIVMSFDLESAIIDVFRYVGVAYEGGSDEEYDREDDWGWDSWDEFAADISEGLRKAERGLAKADRFAEKWGEPVMQQVANFNPFIASANAYGSFTEGKDIYGQEMSKTEGTTGFIASVLPFLKIGKIAPAVEAAVVESVAVENTAKVLINNLNKTISLQKQARHIAGTAKAGGGYLNSVDDAQAVLNAVHSGEATFLGTSKAGHQIFRFNGVTGTNVNLGAGITGQPTNVFMIKGTTSPSIVPTTPFWTP